jgi:Zn finger protein HypA/HybF involved in hydrogenase expression
MRIEFYCDKCGTYFSREIAFGKKIIKVLCPKCGGKSKQVKHEQPNKQKKQGKS